MTPGPWQRMDLLARQLMPSMLTLVLVIINVVPLHIPGFSRVAPLLPLIAVYHWAAFRPRLLPAYAVFLIGLFQDILTGAPIGVNAFVFLAVYGAVLSQKRFFIGKSFFILWLGFSLIAAGASVTEGQMVLVMEAMKMDIDVFAPIAGTVSEVLVRDGQSVVETEVLARIG